MCVCNKFCAFENVRLSVRLKKRYIEKGIPMIALWCPTFINYGLPSHT